MRVMTVRKALTVLALAVLMLTACGEAGSPVPTTEPITLRLGVPFSSSEVPPLLVEAIEQYQEENPHITIELVGTFYLMGYGSVEEIPLDAYLSLSDLDPRGASDGTLFGFNGLSLEPFITSESMEIDQEGIFPLLLDAFRWGGELYALPAGAEVAVMYYNRDIFDAQGVPYPIPRWDWDDFLNTVQRLTTISGEGGDQTGHWGFVANPTFSYLFVSQNGGTILDDPIRPTQAVFDDPRVPEALQWYADMALEHRVMPTVRELERVPMDPSGAFATGKAAMWLAWTFSRGGEADLTPWEFNWGMAPVPRGKTETTWVFPLGYFISADSRYPQEAWDLVRSLSASESFAIPTRSEVLESDSFRQQVGGDLVDVLLDAFAGEHLVLVPTGLAGFHPAFNELWELYVRSVEDLARGDITVERMMERLRERYEGVLLQTP